MILEARSPTCWSHHYVLKRNGRPLGEYRGRWFSESVDVHLLGRRTLRLQKSGWLGGHFILTDLHSDQLLGQADRTGLFTSAWNLDLSGGSARLASPTWFTPEYVVHRGAEKLATVRPIGCCEGGWVVQAHDTLDVCDVILIGLIYHTILERLRQSD